jgi:tRNA 2-thiouridine synthesizing protein A
MSGVQNPIASDAAAVPDQELDARGLNCPLPVLKTKVLLGRMEPGQVLRVTATDPHATIDFEAYCARSGHELIQARKAEGVMEFLIRRAQDPKRV